MKSKIFLAITILLLPLVWSYSSGQSLGHSLHLNLTLLNTTSTVFIPGIGEVSSNSLPAATYTSPPDFFLSSSVSNNLKALVFSQEKPLSLSVSSNSTHHSLSLVQNLSNSQAFLVFTKGDKSVITTRIPLIKQGKFLSQLTPSFSFGLGSRLPVKIILNYTDIDLRGNFIFRQGVHEVTLESNKTGGAKILIINETI